jgi:Domain of unknown function (DUF6457)
MLGHVNSFFDELGERFRRAASRRGVAIEAPTLSAPVAQELLELARVAAHTQERRFAPLASFVAGLTAERVREAGGSVSPDDLAALIREVRLEIEPAPASERDPGQQGAQGA